MQAGSPRYYFTDNSEMCPSFVHSLTLAATAQATRSEPIHDSSQFSTIFPLLPERMRSKAC